MPGMIVVLVQNVEETFLDIHLPGNEELTILQTGADLFFNFINGYKGEIGEDSLAMQFVITGIAIEILERHVAGSKSCSEKIPWILGN
jgi:hypothetical protein